MKQSGKSEIPTMNRIEIVIGSTVYQLCTNRNVTNMEQNKVKCNLYETLTN